MILALDVGNSQIFGGVFDRDKIKFQFRKTSKTGASSDEFGLFLREVLRENGVDPKKIKKICACSVVPDVVHSMRNACRKYFGINPFFLEPGVKTGFVVDTLHPTEVGADRIANAVAAVNDYPNKNLIVIDLGTATTFCVITAKKQYKGGVIAAGLRLCMEALESNTAKLPSVEIMAKDHALGRDTVESIQSGLFYGHIGMMHEIIGRLSDECFGGKRPFIIGTGGFAGLFEGQGIFDTIAPDLVLRGVVLAGKMNPGACRADPIADC